jgi:hypothetical protein
MGTTLKMFRGAVVGSSLALALALSWDELQWRLIERRARRRHALLTTESHHRQEAL